MPVFRYRNVPQVGMLLRVCSSDRAGVVVEVLDGGLRLSVRHARGMLRQTVDSFGSRVQVKWPWEADDQFRYVFHQPEQEPEPTTTTDVQQLRAQLDAAWGIIANVSGGNWESQPEEWRQVASSFAIVYGARCNDRPRLPEAPNTLSGELSIAWETERSLRHELEKSQAANLAANGERNELKVAHKSAIDTINRLIEERDALGLKLEVEQDRVKTLKAAHEMTMGDWDTARGERDHLQEQVNELEAWRHRAIQDAEYKQPAIGLKMEVEQDLRNKVEYAEQLLTEVRPNLLTWADSLTNASLQFTAVPDVSNSFSKKATEVLQLRQRVIDFLEKTDSPSKPQIMLYGNYYVRCLSFDQHFRCAFGTTPSPEEAMQFPNEACARAAVTLMGASLANAQPDTIRIVDLP